MTESLAIEYRNRPKLADGLMHINAEITKSNENDRKRSMLSDHPPFLINMKWRMIRWILHKNRIITTREASYGVSRKS